VKVKARFLKEGAFIAQNPVTIPRAKLVRRLGKLQADALELVEDAVREWLSLK
jgi:mRNA interferase MazF